MKTKLILIIAFNIILFSSNISAKGYKIKVKINGVSDTIVYLGHHWGEKKLAIDTTLLDKNGEGVFQGNRTLYGGVYFIILPSRGMDYFELLIDKDMELSLETDTSNYITNMKFSGSKENTLFYEFQNEWVSLQQRNERFQKAYHENKENEDSIRIYKQKLIELTSEREKLWDKYINENPNSMISVMLKASKDPEIPKFEVPTDCTNPDSLKRIKTYLYKKEHYFDNIDFSDSRLLRTNIFHNKLDTYMKKMILQHPDTIIKEGDKLVKISEADTLMFKYVLQYMFNYYEETKIMGMDKVFVYFGENYYLNDRTPWIDSTYKAKIAERVIALKPTILGLKSENLQLETFEGPQLSLWDVNAKYTILVFYEPSCGHCQKAIPKLANVYKKYKTYQVETFAVYTQHERKEWEEFIKKHGLDWINVYDRYNKTNFRKKYDIYSTPVIYLLDNEKKIIAKRLDVDQIDEMLKQLLQLKDVDSVPMDLE